MSLASSIQPRRSNHQVWGGMPIAEPAGSSGDAGVLEDQKPVGSVRRLLCQPNRIARTIAGPKRRRVLELTALQGVEGTNVERGAQIRDCNSNCLTGLERAKGIEPSTYSWEAGWFPMMSRV
jgi:hypothetical protein